MLPQDGEASGLDPEVLHVSATVLADVDDDSHAVFTAIFGAIAWALTAWIPLFGPLLALIAWVWVINWRYPGGWPTAAAIGAVAWFVALIVLFVLELVLGLGVGAFGVPGV